MPRGIKKENLPSKICVTCGRPFTWRKKWERCWDEVTTCSKSCNNKRRQKGKQEQGNSNASLSEEGEMDTSSHQLQQHKQMHSVATLDDEGFDQDDTKLFLQSLMAAGKINNVETENEKDDSTSEASSVSNYTTLGDQVISFPTPCPQCLAPIETRICPANIPHFKDMLLYCTTCDDCGYKSNELKQGGAIPPKGRRIVLQVTTVQDLSRDVVKSGSAGIQIPEIELELEAGGGGGQGVYTTVEGLIRTMKTTLQQANPFLEDDVSNSTQRERFQQVLQTLQDMADGKVLPFTLIMTDPMAGIYIAPKHSGPDPSANNETVADENISAVDFERSEEQNELLGITGLISADSEQYSREHLSDPDDIRQAKRKARKEAKKAKKAERRAQRQGNGDPDTGKKTCDLCSKRVNVLIRCLHEEGQTDWSMVCGKCWNKVSGGVPDGDANHPHYRYGGLWKNRRAQD